MSIARPIDISKNTGVFDRDSAEPTLCERATMMAELGSGDSAISRDIVGDDR